jgi:phospholipid transport system transporter-binding protein
VSDAQVSDGGVTEGLEATGTAGQFRLAGRAGFAEAKRLLALGERLFADAPAITIDLTGLTRVDSATLALLLEWRRLGARRGRNVDFTGLPPRLTALAQLSGVAELLGENAAAAQGAAASAGSSPPIS